MYYSLSRCWALETVNPREEELTRFCLFLNMFICSALYNCFSLSFCCIICMWDNAFWLYLYLLCLYTYIHSPAANVSYTQCSHHPTKTFLYLYYAFFFSCTLCNSVQMGYLQCMKHTVKGVARSFFELTDLYYLKCSLDIKIGIVTVIYSTHLENLKSFKCQAPKSIIFIAYITHFLT